MNTHEKNLLGRLHGKRAKLLKLIHRFGTETNKNAASELSTAMREEEQQQQQHTSSTEIISLSGPMVAAYLSRAGQKIILLGDHHDVPIGTCPADVTNRTTITKQLDDIAGQGVHVFIEASHEIEWHAADPMYIKRVSSGILKNRQICQQPFSTLWMQ